MFFPQLPSTWLSVKLIDIAELNMGQSPSSSDVNDTGEGIAFFQGKAEFGRLHPTARKFCTLPKKTAESGDVLLSVRAPVGPTNVANQKTAIGRGLAAIRAEKNIVDQQFLLHYFRCIEPWMSQQGTGTTFKAVSGAFLKELHAVLPPLAEQKAIADKLDTLLAQVETTQARLERIPQILKRFRQSVLAAAVGGKLTEEWRKQAVCREATNFSLIAKEERKRLGIRENKHASQAVSEKPFRIPRSWVWHRLGNVALKITDGAHNTPKLMTSGYPYVMAKDLTGGQLDFSSNRYISEKEHRELYLKCFPKAGDLLVVNIGAGTGNNVLVNVDFEFSFKNIAIIKRPSFIVSNYLKLFFDSQKKRIFDEQTRGGAQPFLSLTTLNDIAFAIPPVDEQTEIVRRVDELFAHADRIEQQVNNALTRVNNLTQSILAKAFRGELTEQWCKDNPELISGENSAEALLERIRAERAAVAGKKKVRKVVKKAADGA